MQERQCAVRIRRRPFLFTQLISHWARVMALFISLLFLQGVCIALCEIALVRKGDF
jgi:hypothetical protein